MKRTISKSVRIAVREQWPICCYCKQPYSRPSREFSIDHVVPVFRGGSKHPANLVGCCRSCNVAKGARTPQEWLAELAENIREMQAMQALMESEVSA